jgi:hypothetical protein
MNQGHGRLLALCLFALLLSVYLLTFSGIYHSSDEMSILGVTDSLARRGAVDIDLLRWMGKQQGDFGPDGHLYSNKGLGTSLAALPFYWLGLQWERVGNVQAGMLTSAVITALTGVLIYRFLRRLGFSDGASLGTALAFGLGTMAWPYARYLFAESLAGLGLLWSAYSLHCYGDRRDWVASLLAGVGLGLGLLTRLNTAIAVPFFALLLLVHLNRNHGRRYRDWIRPLVTFALPILAALACTGWYNWVRFGSPWTTGYQPEERFATFFFKGFYGLVLNPGKGLLWYSPLLLAAVAAWPAFYRRHRGQALLIAAVVLGNVAFYSPWHLWWAGHSWGPRFLLTVVPLAILPLAPAVEVTSRRRPIAIGLGVLALLSIAVQILGVAVDFNLYLEDVYAELGLYHPATLYNPTYSPLLRQIAYLHPENLDLAWARGGALDWWGLGVGVLLVLAATLALLATWRGRRYPGIGSGLLVLLGLGMVFSLLRYAPEGDVAEAAHALKGMERSGEAGTLTDLVLTGAFQDAYDGVLPVWGVPSRDKVGGKHDAMWTIGYGQTEPAVARFQVGTVRLDYNAPPGVYFEADRLLTPPLDEEVLLGGAIQLVSVLLDTGTVRPGEALPVTLCWRDLALMDISYTVFLQVIDEGGVKAAQMDRLPCDGGCPTNTWRPGDLVAERYSLPVRADAPPGRYQLIAGMYDLATGELLPRVDTGGNPVSTFVLLGSVAVQP